jgi:MFS family permease
MLGPTPQAVEPSYAALLRVPGFARVVLGTLLARLGGQMWEIVLVLFVLQRYRSPSLAGLTVLLSIVPGLAMSPVAGALLDRQGRLRLMIFDYAVTAGLMAAIAALSLGHRLPPPLLLMMVTVLGVSNILSITGARSLFPLMVPRTLWDRANGLDTSMYSLTAVIGPAMAGITVARFGPEAALLVTAGVAAIAALSLIAVHEPIARADAGGSLIGDAWAALVYVVRHRSLRGLAITLFLSNIGFGVLPVGIPVLVLRHLHGSAATVGQIFAVSGLAGLVAGLLIGKVRTEGRERWLAGGLRRRRRRRRTWIGDQRWDLRAPPAADGPQLVRARFRGVHEPQLCRGADRIGAIRPVAGAFDRATAPPWSRHQRRCRGCRADTYPWAAAG